MSERGSNLTMYCSSRTGTMKHRNLLELSLRTELVTGRRGSTSLTSLCGMPQRSVQTSSLLLHASTILLYLRVTCGAPWRVYFQSSNTTHWITIITMILRNSLLLTVEKEREINLWQIFTPELFISTLYKTRHLWRTIFIINSTCCKTN